MSKDTTIYNQLDPRYEVTADMSTIHPKDFGPMMNAKFQLLRKILVGIDEQLLQAMFALACIEHILWIAGPGVAKSMAAEMLMDVFEDADQLSLQITKDMPQDAIFGHIIPKELIEKGEEIRNLEKGIVDVEFFFADEFLDGSAWTIRTCLNIFNERKYRSKSQGEIDAPLHSVIATTNFFRNSNELEAVIDRFLAVAIMPAADSLVEHYRIGRGYTKTSGKEIELPKLRYADLLAFAEWIESPDGITIPDGLMVLHYVVMTEFLNRRYEMELEKWANTRDIDLTDPENKENAPSMRDLGVYITPRTAAKCLDFVKARAGFEGRDYVVPEDLRAGGLVYCVIGDDSGHSELWNEVCEKFLVGLTDVDLKTLDKIGSLVDFVGDLFAEQSEANSTEFLIGGKAFAVTRQNIVEARAKLFGGMRGMHAAVQESLLMLDEGIAELDQPVHKTGIKLDMWGS